MSANIRIYFKEISVPSQIVNNFLLTKQKPNRRFSEEKRRFYSNITPQPTLQGQHYATILDVLVARLKLDILDKALDILLLTHGAYHQDIFGIDNNISLQATYHSDLTLRHRD